MLSPNLNFYYGLSLRHYEFPFEKRVNSQDYGDVLTS